MALAEDMPDMEVEEENTSEAMDEAQISGILKAEIETAIGYSETEYEEDRAKALQYYRGTMNDTPAEKGRSQVVSYDVADTIGEIMPSLMRVFFSGGNIVEYEPSVEGEEDQAAQATDFVNYIFTKKCDGYNVLWDAFHDGLLHRNGVLTYFYDSKPTFGTHYFTGLTEDQLAQLSQDPDVEVQEATQSQIIVPDLQSGQPIPVTVYDVRIRRVKERGRVKIMAVPPEEFLINREATCVADARFVCRRYMTTRSDLRLEGYDPEVIETIPTYNDLEQQATVQERYSRSYNYNTDGEVLDESQQEVQVYDCYVRMDVNGDGISEWMHIVVGGAGGDTDHMLLTEEWHEDVPFTDLTPERVPHRWQGRSIFDEMNDIQRIKTVVLRQTLDSCYISNNPSEYVNSQALVDPDELLTREIGKRIRVKGDPRLAVMPQALPFIGQHTFPMLDYLDQVVTKRTGISQASSALDPEVLQNQSATAANLAASAQYSKIELIARNYAEQLRRAFRAILKLVVENSDQEEMIRLRGKFVRFDPRSWNADMDCTVNIGLGTGSRDRDMAMLQAIAMEQDKYLENLGPQNPYVPLEKRIETSRKMVEAGGLKNSEMFFGEPTEEELQQFQQQQAQKAQEPPPDVKAKLQADQMKAQGQQQIDMQKMQAQGQMEMIRMDREFALKQYQIDQEMGLKREQLAAELQLKRDLAILDHEAKLQTGAMQANATSQVHVGGEPG